jgi:hypothetical protein
VSSRDDAVAVGSALIAAIAVVAYVRVRRSAVRSRRAWSVRSNALVDSRVPSSPIAFRLGHADRQSAIEQLVDQVERALSAGYLRAGDPLPPVTDTVAVLSINPVTVLCAYSELERRGVARHDPEQGTSVVSGPEWTA